MEGSRSRGLSDCRKKVEAAAVARRQAILDTEAKCKAKVEEVGMELG